MDAKYGCILQSVTIRVGRDGLLTVLKTSSPSTQIDTETKFRRGAGCPFQRAILLGSCSQTTGQRPNIPLGARKTCLQVAAFDGSAVKSAFALLLTKVTKPAAGRRKERNDSL